MAAQATRRPHVNSSDIPELLPGARASATPAQREAFEQRCRELYREEVAEYGPHCVDDRAGWGRGAIPVADLEAMFPSLDGALVRALAMEASTVERAVELLLALSAATASPAAAEAEGCAPAQHDLGLCDLAAFPVLHDAGGWQVADPRLLGDGPGAGAAAGAPQLGPPLTWSARASAARGHPHAPRALAPRRAAPLAAPLTAPLAAALAAGIAPPAAPGVAAASEATDDVPELLTDYEVRHLVGQQRALRRPPRGRGRVSGAGRGLRAPAVADLCSSGSRGRAGGPEDSESDSDASSVLSAWDPRSPA